MDIGEFKKALEALPDDATANFEIKETFACPGEDPLDMIQQASFERAELNGKDATITFTL